MKKYEFWFRLAKTCVINIIGGVILLQVGKYMYTHDLTILGNIALCILTAIGIYFIKKNYTEPTIEELAEVAIGGFIYALKRKTNEIEKNESAEQVLNDTPVGEVIKKYIKD